MALVYLKASVIQMDLRYPYKKNPYYIHLTAYYPTIAVVTPELYTSRDSLIYT